MGDHLFRLLTWRHDGRGLASDIFPIFVFLLILAATVGATRWAAVGEATWGAAFLKLLATQIVVFGVAHAITDQHRDAIAFCNGIAILSMAVDTVALIVFLVTASRGTGVFLVYETLAQGIFLYRMLADKRKTG